MLVLRGIMPFICYAILSSLIDWRVAALVAAGIALAIIGSTRRSGARSGELIIEYCGFAWFIVAAALAYLLPDLGLRHYVGAIGQLVLTAAIIVTLIVKQPFTTPIARRKAPELIWQHSTFIAFNTRISTGWAVGLGLSGILLLVLAISGVRTTWLEVVIIIAGILVPAMYQRREIAAFQANAAQTSGQPS